MVSTKNIGSALVEYIIPTVVVALLVGLTLYAFIDSQKLLKFAGISANNATGSIGPKLSPNDTISVKTTSTTSTAAGALGGTEDAPVSKCANGVCTIDFGSFVLSGIPDDFNEYAKANGSSGGSNLLADLLMQIADQLEKAGDTAGADDYRKLANLGHYIGATQKQAEDIINNSKGTTVNATQALQLLEKEKCATPISDIASLFPKSSGTTVLNAVITNISNARNFEEFPASNAVSFSDNYAPYAFNTLYDKVMSDSKYSANIKSVTEMLYRKMDSVGIGLSTSIRGLSFPSGTSIQIYDPVTGKPLSGLITTPASDAYGDVPKANFLDPSTSVGSNLQSALICVTGKNRDTGTNCNKK